ncbi:MAG: RNA-binding cell elongation regulator Jag/EloR [Salinispira sp.]
MIHEFEGKTEKDAVEIAIKELGLERSQIDVELLNDDEGGLFNLQKTVRIRVHTQDDESDTIGNTMNYHVEPDSDYEKAVLEFLENVVEKMGYDVSTTIMYRENNKIAIRIDSESSGILIGRKGKNLDAIQLFTNIFAHRYEDNDVRIIVDIENYRERREEALIRLAHKIGDEVVRTRETKLLEPMNPFERRIIHTALSDVENIETVSEGDGSIKQVRVMYKGFEDIQ